MNTIQKSIVTAACAGAAVFAGNATAADTQRLNIAADIVGVCKFASTAGYDVAFDPIDATSNSDATKNVAISYLCTNGTAASSIQVQGAASGVMVPISNGTSSLPVTLTWVTPTTVGTGFAAGAVPIAFNLTATIPSASLKTAVAGRYFTRSTISILP